MSLAWNASSVKAQCKLASHELRQLKHRKDSQNFIIRKDIATLLRQQNVWLAHEKAQNLLIEDNAADLLERLEMHVELLLERLSQLNSKSPLSPIVLEAVATIVYAAPHLDSRELQAIRNLLLNRFGAKNIGHVSPVVIQSLAPSPPSASEINACLAKIALAFSVDWAPEPTRHEIVDSLARMVSGSSQSVELSALRRLCRHGIPDKPSWLRPRIWKLLLCLESTTESTWTAELCKQRDNYYDLVRQFLGPFSTAEAPSVPLSPLDASLLDISKQLSRIPTSLFVFLQNPPDTSLLCPLDLDAPDNIKISSASNLILRLAALRHQSPPTHEIRSNGQDSPDHTQTNADPALQTTFLAADLLNLPKVDPKHASALLRILYIHAMINPGILSPHVPSLLIPLYIALTQEDEQEDAVHAEADTFWLFEAMMAEFSELEDENISNMWLRKFGERVAWADKNLYDILCARQLDPALPHYSYRWLATLLTHSLPFSSIFPVWDVLFSRPTRSRGTNPKLDHLLDVCTAMLLCVRPTLLRLCGAHSEQERTEASEYLPEDSDAFMEAMTFLQNYRIESAGGIERILQTANDLLRRRHDEPKAGMVFRIKETVFGGFTNQSTSSSESDSSSDAKDEEGSQTDTFTGRIATTLWKGITNQAAMEPPPSPPAPSTPKAQSPPDESATNTAQWSSTAYSTLWGYAERMKDSDTAAALAKVSSNWKAKALVATWGRTENGREVNGDSPPTPGALEKDTKPNVSPSPSRPSSIYSPPPRPAYFRPPRDSYIPSDTDKPLLSSLNTSVSSPANDSGIVSRTKASLAAMTHSPPLRSAPRPLILSSGSPITPTSLLRLPNSAPAPDSHTWDNIRVRRGTHRDSLSSVSSVSDSMGQPLNWNTSDRDSDISGSSRRILLNRKSVSPLAPHYRTQHLKQSTGALSDVGQELPIDNSRSNLSTGHSTDTSATRSPPRLNSPPFTPLLHTPSSNELSFDGDVHVTEPEKQRGSILLEHPQDQMLVSEPHSKRPLRRKTPPKQVVLPDTAESTPVRVPTKLVRVRAKRYLTQSANLPLLHEQSAQEASDNSSSLENLQVEWPSEEHDMSMTPRASNFDPGKYLHKVASVERRGSNEGRTRKVSGNQRVRKVSSEGRGAAKDARESAAEEGDDEGYDDLLSAYESEEGTQFLGA